MGKSCITNWWFLWRRVLCFARSRKLSISSVGSISSSNTVFLDNALDFDGTLNSISRRPNDSNMIRKSITEIQQCLIPKTFNFYHVSTFLSIDDGSTTNYISVTCPFDYIWYITAAKHLRWKWTQHKIGITSPKNRNFKTFERDGGPWKKVNRH